MGLREDIYADDWALGEMLDRDVDGKSLKEVEDILFQRRAALRMELDRGVAPDQFKKGQAMIAGYDAALQGLGSAWKRRHGSAF